jgi:uncharacterized protein (TIGR03790 family)
LASSAPRAAVSKSVDTIEAVRFASLLVLGAAALGAQTGANVLLVVNRDDARSVAVADYYRPRRSVPLRNVCSIRTTSEEEIGWDAYEQQIERPIGNCLKNAGLADDVLYIVTTLGMPLKVRGAGSGLTTESCSVDSELALLYAKLKGRQFPRAGGIPNPLFMNRSAPFRHPEFAIYLVTRLAAYSVADTKAMIDRALAAKNRGKFVLDLSSAGDEEGNNHLRTAAILLPPDRVIIDESTKVLYDQKEVIGYASWGSNDGNRKRRRVGFEWLPGAIASEFVSTNARTLKQPPGDWMYTTWADKLHWFAGSPQGLSGDLLEEGATGASGNVYEPYLAACARPDYLFPAYYHGRNLAESYYIALRWLSWQGVVFGDPLCAIGRP